jgi:hypothetical protein
VETKCHQIGAKVVGKANARQFVRLAKAPGHILCQLAKPMAEEEL